jgi:hypothetical protein
MSVCWFQVSSVIIFPAILFQGAFFKPSHFTFQLPSSGKPGAFCFGDPSHPAVIIATA